MQRPAPNPKQHLRRLRRQIERLPPYPALFILAAPLAVVEPLKLATVFIAGEGHWITGGLVMVCAYAVSLFVTHWLFVIVKPKLLTLQWFARALASLVSIRDRAWRWVANRAGTLAV
jgi:hypothetical protein